MATASSPSQPICVMVIGMAGSGKSTLVQRLRSEQPDSYVLNLDPAVYKVNYSANIDIRDTVNYKEVMKQYQLGPNGAIMTALNLFATRFDQVVDLIAKQKEREYIFVDTPGQIEVFTWSASGTIITESLASTLPSCIVYVIDTPRCQHPSTFMSNMLYACSVLYKTKLPFVIVFNKTDVVDCAFVETWMTDFEAFQTALSEEQDESYMSSLNRSMSLVLDEFYENLHSVGVSAASGAGMSELYAAIKKAKEEYKQYYLPELQKKIELNALSKQKIEAQRKEQQLEKLEKDMKADKAKNTEGDDIAATPTQAQGEEATEEEEYHSLIDWIHSVKSQTTQQPK